MLVRVTATKAVILVLALLGGCGSAYYATPVPHVDGRRLANLHALAERDTGCPAEELTAWQVGDRVWRVGGCGETREYAIFPRGFGARWQRIPPVSARATNELACDSIAMRAEAGGAVNAAGCGRAASYELECGAERCDWVMTRRGGAWETPAANEGARVETTPSGTVIVVPETTPTATDPAIAAALRRVLDEESEAVRACGAAGARVRARWSADGLVRISLDPPWGGTERERCVQSSLPIYRISGGSGGEVAHVVR